MSTAPLNILKALAEETRLRLAVVLTEHELNVAELTAICQMGQSRVSRHLKILADAGLAVHRRDGQWHFYAAAREGEAAQVLQCLRPMLQGEEQHRQDLERAAQVIEDRARARERFFDSLAQGWSTLRAEALAGLDLEAEVLARMQPCATALDMGCGSGEMLPALASRADVVIGVDSAPRMLEECRRRHGGLGAKLSLRLGELEHLPLKENEAQFVLAALVLHHLFDPALGVAEAFRVAAPGARFVIVEFCRHSREDMRQRFGDRWLGFGKEELDAWLRGAGFTVAGRDVFTAQNGLDLQLVAADKPTL